MCLICVVDTLWLRGLARGKPARSGSPSSAQAGKARRRKSEKSNPFGKYN